MKLINLLLMIGILPSIFCLPSAFSVVDEGWLRWWPLVVAGGAGIYSADFVLQRANRARHTMRSTDAITITISVTFVISAGLYLINSLGADEIESISRFVSADELPLTRRGSKVPGEYAIILTVEFDRESPLGNRRLRADDFYSQLGLAEKNGFLLLARQGGMLKSQVFQGEKPFVCVVFKEGLLGIRTMGRIKWICNEIDEKQRCKKIRSISSPKLTSSNPL